MLRVVAWLARTMLALAFMFFGYMKASLQLADLARYDAWVSGMGWLVARGVGLSEIALASGLVVAGIGGWRRSETIVAVLLILNQLAAIAVHVSRGQDASLRLNILWLALLLFLVIRNTWPKAAPEPAS